MSELNPYDLEQAHKQVHRLIRSQEGKQALRDRLGYHFVFEGDPDFELAMAQKKVVNPVDKPRVAVLLPSHRSPQPETTQAFIHMAEMSRDTCTLLPQPGVASSVVHWVRNELLMRLYKSGTEFDYVLFMDDDMVPADTALIQLLNHKVDIVAGACTVRQDPPLPNFRMYDPATYSFKTVFEWSGDGLLEVGAVGTGFVLIKREVLDAIGEYYLSCAHEVKYLGMSADKATELSAKRRTFAAQSGNNFWFEFLKQPGGEGEYGEDISFCFKARECGFKIYVDTSVRPGHIGSYAYGIDDYKFYQSEVMEREKLKAEILAPIVGPEEVLCR